MVSCTDCVHYEACKMWYKAVDTATDSLNERFNNYTKQNLVTPLAGIGFPQVAETKEELCDNYEKRKRI